MNPTQVTEVVNELFALLETKLASRPVLLMVLNTLQAAADALIPQIVSNVNAKTKTKVSSQMEDMRNV